jgi:hypothetical protein
MVLQGRYEAESVLRFCATPRGHMKDRITNQEMGVTALDNTVPSHGCQSSDLNRRHFLRLAVLGSSALYARQCKTRPQCAA